MTMFHIWAKLWQWIASRMVCKDLKHLHWSEKTLYLYLKVVPHRFAGTGYCSRSPMRWMTTYFAMQSSAVLLPSLRRVSTETLSSVAAQQMDRQSLRWHTSPFLPWDKCDHGMCKTSSFSCETERFRCCYKVLWFSLQYSGLSCLCENLLQWTPLAGHSSYLLSYCRAPQIQCLVIRSI